MKIKYSEIFYSIQGEGRWVGTPSVFIRLFGCNFECRGFGQERGNLIPVEEMPYMKDPKAEIDHEEAYKSIEELPVTPLGCDSSASWAMKYKHLQLTETIEQVQQRIIDLLPNDKEFDIWRSLRVKHALIKSEFESDILACKIVNEVSMTNFEDFWKMSQIFCQLIQGNEDDALFDAELLRASGGGDEEFFDLLGLMIGESETPLIDGEKINLLHVAMMDQLRNVVPNDFVTRTPYYNYNILLKVENIQPSTKAFILDKLIELNKISKEEIETYYNAFGDKSIILTEALSNLKKNRGPQSRADVWNSIKNELDNENINKSILEVIAIEAQNGRPLQALNLYSDLLLESDNSTDEHDAIIRKFKFINGKNKNKT